MKSLAWISAVCLALPLVAGCPSDEDDSAGEETASSESNTAASTSDTPTTTDQPATSDPTTMADGSSGGEDDLQVTWGAPCTEDSECVALLGEGGVCLTEAVIFELPGGYCSKTCTLPEGSKYSLNDAQCDPAGGVDCIGQAPLFEVCAPQCTSDSQCSRDQYGCRNFPLIAEEGDPTYCLMPDCCQDSCDAC
ncbi:MAG: hypothetical protein ACRBN8_07415 [Nannocystales bacterium]